jgi:protein O-mannosyl-transferase
MDHKLLNNPKILYPIIFLLAFILYGNTIPNDFALDDSIVITQNVYVQKGIAGISDILGKETFTGFFGKKKNLVEGGRYRPLSLVTFAIEQAVWKGNPHVSHLINIILYGLLCVVLFKCILKITEFIGYRDIAVSVSFIATLLFAVHPLHTEVVANIKGRDELLSLLFSLLTILLIFKFIDTKQVWMIFWAGILFFLGLLAKENTITVPIIVAIILYFSLIKISKGAYTRTFLVLLITALVYFIIRRTVIGEYSSRLPGELMNNPFLEANQSQKLATILYTLLLYLKLLIFPNPLTYDYYPYHIKLQTWSNLMVIISLVIYSFLFLSSIYWFFKKKYKLPSLAILIFLVTLLPMSNLFINTGSFMNERFVFFGSIGFCLIVGFGLLMLIKNSKGSRIQKYAGITMLSVILVAFSLRTIARNPNWKDNYTLFTHDVKISSGSAKANVTAGGVILDRATSETDSLKKKEYLNQSITYLEKALSIYPNYVDALLLAGNAHFQNSNDFLQADKYYSRIFELASAYNLAFSNYKIILSSVKDPEIKKYGYLKILFYRPDDFDANCELGSLFGKTYNNLDSAIFYLDRAVKIKPNSKDANRDLGVAYAMKGQPDKALYFFEKTVELDAEDPSNHINLGLSYQQIGQLDKADQQFRIAKELQALKK